MRCARFRAPSRQQLAEHYIRALNIKTADAETPIRNLSGGNQQKVLLARWLAMQPKLIILDEPTRGIDVGAKAEIEKLISSLREKGMAVLFISSELEEVVRVSSRASSSSATENKSANSTASLTKTACCT